jgi:hypothetical protein
MKVIQPAPLLNFIVRPLEETRMGVSSILMGYVREARPGEAAGGDPALLANLQETARVIARHNEAVLESLPERGEFPPLCRHMFGWPPTDDFMITYKNRLFHLAAAMKEVDWYLRDWLDQFEGLLRQLYWESAFVRVETAYLGTHEFCWRPMREWVDQLCKGSLSPIRMWSFSTTMEASDLDRLRERAQ